MFKHDLKLKMAILFIVFLESWLLGALRFDWNFASFLYGVLNIPFGKIFHLELFFFMQIIGYGLITIILIG